MMDMASFLVKLNTQGEKKNFPEGAISGGKKKNVRVIHCENKGKSISCRETACG